MFFFIFDLGQAISIIQVAEMTLWNYFPLAKWNSPSKKFLYLRKIKPMHKHFMKTPNFKVIMFMRTNWLCFHQCAGCLRYHKLVDNLGLMAEYDLREEINPDSNTDQVWYVPINLLCYSELEDRVCTKAISTTG